ncbi:MAG: homocysteine S-methyltransferase family protein [Nocardioides sp.]
MPAAQWVTDGGLETDLIFNRGVELAEFAAFPLLDTDHGRAVLADYYRGYAEVAARAGKSILLETPTWRANPEWAARVGYDGVATARVNEEAVEFLRDLAQSWQLEGAWLVGGVVGPRGDGYVPGDQMSVEMAADYHRSQLAAFASAGADRATALTLTDVNEAIGIALAGQDCGLPVAIGFTVETDGCLPGGTGLDEAIQAVDDVAAPAYYVVNCAHPDHVLSGIDASGPWRDRVQGLRVNASRLSHAELDESEVLDDGDANELAADVGRLLESLPAVQVVGGCCGTDVRHVAAMWGVGASRS